MDYAFDGAARLITLSPGATVLEVKDLYSRWKDWLGAGDNAKYLPAFDVVGGNPTVGLNSISSYFYLLNGWRIRPQEADHTLTVSGILLVDGGGDPFADTIGNWRIRIEQVTPMQAEAVATQGTAGPSASQIAAAVWGNPFVKTLLTVRKFLHLR